MRRDKAKKGGLSEKIPANGRDTSRGTELDTFAGNA